MSDTDRQLGRAEQELRQAMDCIQQCRDALDGMLDRYGMDTRTDAIARSARRMADIELALYASRQAGTECAAVAKDVLLAGLGVKP